MVDLRCQEIAENPLDIIPLYFDKGWLGGAALKTSFFNILTYKRANRQIRDFLDKGEISRNDYIAAAEESFLYGKAGLRIWYLCWKNYIRTKLHHGKVEDIGTRFSGGTPYLEEKEEIAVYLEGCDKDHVWMFDAGHNGRKDFRGNPKYLFVYINKYRPDIHAYWYCEADAADVINQVRELGFHGVLRGTEEAEYALNRTGVVVSEQLREYFPEALLRAKYLNLWHGIGFKRVERARLENEDDLRVGIAKKYIAYNTYYRNNQLLAVTSPIYEKEFIEDFGITARQILRTGYLRCMYQQHYEPVCTFDHDILACRGLPEDTKLAVYAPTFRARRGNLFATAIKDFDALYRCCEESGILLIFKAHPHIENEAGFLEAKKQYGSRPYFLFWDNCNDFYEIIHKTDLVIYDYSSMFSDFLCAGVEHYIRYIFDEDEYMSVSFTQGREAYYERTCGRICRSFAELLEALQSYEADTDTAEIEAINQKLWAYAGEDDFEKTIQAVMDFQPLETEYPTLYSFDVFDTLLSRKGLRPYSIFHAVRERMSASREFPEEFTRRYPDIRHWAEMNVREYYRKTVNTRCSEKMEIQMKEIFRRMEEVYGITQEQSGLLLDWEIEEELKSIVPLDRQIDLVRELLSKGETVILISDMYLPKEVIQKMLGKAEPKLAELPLFVSCEYGFQKTTRLLFFEAYRSFQPFYPFGKWVHYGDNPAADRNPARNMGISTVMIPKTEFNEAEQAVVDKLYTYDAYLFTALCARLRESKRLRYSKADFVINIVASTLIPYVDWVLRDAMGKGFQRLYFVARDGHPLKRIADAVIERHHWPIETRYLYASRRTWRIPSYIDKIDDTFWIQEGGNFNNISSKEELCDALYITEEDFKIIIPEINLDEVDWSKDQPGRLLAPVIRGSDRYQEYLLGVAEQLRALSGGYLEQEFDRDKKFACVEYWGRGYNQECMTRLWNHTTGKEEMSHFYYARSIYPSQGLCVRYNMTSIDVPVAPMEAVFANMPYKTITEYKECEGKICPVIVPNDSYDKELYQAMEEILPEMAGAYAGLGFQKPEEMDKRLFDFMLAYINENKASGLIAENIGALKYSMSFCGKIHEYAGAYDAADLKSFADRTPRGKGTESIAMSYGRMHPNTRAEYDEMYQIEPGDDPAGGFLLSKNEILENRKFRKKYEDTLGRALAAQRYYEEACLKYPVYNKICVVSTTKNFDDDTLKTLSKLAVKQRRIYVEWLTSSCPVSEDGRLMELLAMARYVIIDGNVPQLLKIAFREETTGIRLLDRAFRLYHFGRTENIRLKWQYRYDALIYEGRAGAVESTTMEGLEHSGYGYNLATARVFPGACVTDVLFDDGFKCDARDKIAAFFPEAKNKKIIFYLPQPRKRPGSAVWLELLDMEILAGALADEYVMLVDMRSNKSLAGNCRNIIEVSGFSRNVTNMPVSLRSLLSVADVVVGDYRDTFFESVLLDRPVFSTASDMDKIQSDSLNMIYDLRQIYPFPVVENAEELIEKLRHIDAYDASPLKKFRDKYFIGCDGHATERLLSKLL